MWIIVYEGLFNGGVFLDNLGAVIVKNICAWTIFYELNEGLITEEFLFRNIGAWIIFQVLLWKTAEEFFL